MTKDKFRLGPEVLRGRTIANVNDILLQVFLPNDFAPRERSQIARAGADELATNAEYQNGWKRGLRQLEIGGQVHAVDKNYFNDQYVTPVIQDLLREVHSECQPS